MPTLTYTNAIELTTDIWKYSTKEQKEELLRQLGYKEEWAKYSTINELVSHDGGMVARDLKNLSSTYLKNHGGKLTITWK